MSDELQTKATNKDQPKAKRTVEITYWVKRPFKYMGEMLKAGDEFVPMGAPLDAQLINQAKYVGRREVAVNDAEKARRTPKRGEG